MNKKNFSVKIFAGITGILLAVGMSVFCILWIFIPKIYESNANEQIAKNSETFAIELGSVPMTEWANLLMEFCLTNNTSAAIFDESGEEIAVFTVTITENTDKITQSETYDFHNYSYTFTGDEEPYTIVFYFSSDDVKNVTNTFEKLFPIVIILVLLISIFIAFFYTRFVVNIKNLQIANEKLQADIAEERRRRSFFSAVSHELKTPVTILKGELDGMILNVGKFKDRDKYLLEAYETTESIEELVKEIMTAAKLDIVKIAPEEINLAEIVSGCLKKIDELTLEKNIIIKQNFSDTPIYADKKLITIAVSNIIGNAVKHSPQGAVIDLRFNENSLFSVANNGENADETQSETDPGGGLGLYIVKSILDLHEFKYSFENAENGSVFTINFTKK